MLSAIIARIQAKLTQLYGEDIAASLYSRLSPLLNAAPPTATSLALTEKDVMLITYADQLHRAGEKPLATLHQFLTSKFASRVNCVHLLPFYPYSSDDGFSVIDYYAVNPSVGEWAHIAALRQDFRLMFDAVFNHISAKSRWFEAFLRDEAPYKEYFTVLPPETDVSQVVRPRTTPVLTPFDTPSGTKYVWTTFSADQIDLNFANPDVLLDMIKVLLFYVQQGAAFIRLDAIAFIWKTLGTGCIHLPETHLIIQLMRDVLDIVAPEVILITETNVPHAENISYFGDGSNEAQLVYNFALPPLILHTLHTGNTHTLTQWAASLERVSDRTTYFNFTASHDGIGVRPVTGILNSAEIDALVAHTLAHGGRVSYRTLPDGGKSPYELNITYFDAITHPDITSSQPDTAVKRFMVSQAIMLALVGMPGIYFHSLVGSRNFHAGAARTGHNRTINREKLAADALIAELTAENSLRYKVYHRYCELLKIRTAQPAFHPLGKQRVYDLNPAVFAVERIAPDDSQRILALHNVTGMPVIVDLSNLKHPPSVLHDLLTDTSYNLSKPMRLAPYQIIWLAQK